MKKIFLGILIGVVSLLLIVGIGFYFLTMGPRNHNRGGMQMALKDSTLVNNDKPPKQQLLVYGEYMDLDSTDYLLIPLAMKTLEEDSEKGFDLRISKSNYSDTDGRIYSRFKYNFYSLNFGNCNNIIFYNKKNEQTHLLLQNRAIISQFYFPFYEEDYRGEKYWFILLGIQEDDTNKDGFINGEDAEKVYITNLAGKNIKQITPNQTQLIDWFIDPTTNNILMKVRLDSNHDNKFNMHDEIEILKTSIKNPAQGKAIIGKKIKNDIKRILNQIK